MAIVCAQCLHLFGLTLYPPWRFHASGLASEECGRHTDRKRGVLTYTEILPRMGVMGYLVLIVKLIPSQ